MLISKFQKHFAIVFRTVKICYKSYSIELHGRVDTTSYF